jgi:hypothetical protein
MSLEDKINEIKENIDDLSENKLNKLYKAYEKIINESDEETNDESSSSEEDNIIKKKEKLLLKMINKILENSEKETITKLTDFKNINREDIISQSKIYEKMEHKLFKVFDKKECGWYQRIKIKNYILSFLKKAVGSIGYEFISEQKELPIKIDGVNYRKAFTFYTIK